MTWGLEVAGHRYTNKLLAIQENQKTGQPIIFRAPDSFEVFDFSLRPSLSLDQLCVRHAKMLRQKYNRVHLFYSGGCDSHFILKTFIDNDIKIDKVIMVKSGFKQADFEIDDYALPFIKKCGLHYEIREPSIDYYRAYYLETPNKVRTQNEYWQHFRLNNHFENVGQTDSDTVNIFGKEKPKLTYVDDKWYTYMLDVEVTPQPGQHNFFLDDPEIYSEQCHMLLDHIGKEMDKSQFNLITHYDEHQDFWNIGIGRYKPGEYFPLKVLSENGFHNNKDQLAIQSAEPRLVLAWKRRNGKLLETYGTNWFNQGDPAMGTIGVFSKFFGLTEKSVKTVDELYPNGFKIQ